MKLNKDVTSQRRKQRRNLFQAPDHERGKHLRCRLSKDLIEKYGVKRLTVIRGDKVKILSGHKDLRVEGEVKEVDRNKYRIHVEGAHPKGHEGKTYEKPRYVAIAPSNCEIVDLKMYANRERIIQKLGKK